MTIMRLELPDEVADAMRRKGLLTPDGATELLREALRSRAVEFIEAFAKETEARGIPPMSEAEIGAEIAAARKERGA